MDLTKKIVLVLLILNVLVPFSLGSAEEPEYFPLIYGTTSNPSGFDPLGVYDMTSGLIIQNCFEGLFAFDCHSSPGEIIPELAADFGVWNAELTEWTIPLREDVTWWDGTEFTADDVVWNLERLNQLSQEKLCDHSSLWTHEDGKLIMDEIEALGNNEVQITLTKPWLDIKALLAFWGSSMIKPLEGYENKTIPIEDYEQLIGTGPFMLDSYTEAESTVLTRFDAYRLGPAHIHEIIIQILDNRTILAEALFNEEIHTVREIPFDKWTEAENNPNIGVELVARSCIYFFHMSDLVAYDVRKAMQYAYNYTYNEQEYFRGIGTQTTHPIPIGMEGYNADLPGLPYYNLESARNLLLKSTNPEIMAAITINNLTEDSTTAEWRVAAESTNPIGHYNFTSYGTGLFSQLADNAKDIGVLLDHDIIGDWVCYLCYIDEYRDLLNFIYDGWYPDYYDPVNMLEPLFATGAFNNYNGLANATIDANMAALHTLSGEEKLAKVDEIVTQIIVEQAHALYFIQSADLFAWNKDLITDGIDTFFNIQDDKYFYELSFALSQPANPGIPGFPIFPVVFSFIGITVYLCGITKHQI